MKILQIKQNFVTDEEIKDFEWGKKWIAERIFRELRGEQEFLFASVKKNYGVIEKTHALDLGNKAKDYRWIGRFEDRVGEREYDNDPESPTYSQRVYKEPKTYAGQEYNEKTKKYEPVTYQDGRLVYKYYCEATPENLDKFKSMIGKLENGKTTQLIFIFGSSVIDIPNPDVFFHPKDAVKNFEKSFLNTLNKTTEDATIENLTKALEAVVDAKAQNSSKK